MPEFTQIVTTTGTEQEATRIADGLVQKRLAGCVQIVGPITSIYRWQENVETAREWRLDVKSRTDLFDAVSRLISELHTYDEPEIIAVPIVNGSDGYLNWLDQQLQKQ